MPLPPDPDGERPARVVGRWLGRCERGCATALCGPCLTARATTVLQRATRRLEVIVSGLGTGYTMMDEDDARTLPTRANPGRPVSARRRRRRRRRRGSRPTRRRPSPSRVRRGASRSAANRGGGRNAQVVGVGGDGALFAAAAARLRAEGRGRPGRGPSDASGDSPSRAPASAEADDSHSEPATVPIPTDARLARCPNRDCGAPVELLPPSAPPPGGSWRSATPSRADGSPARLSNTSTRVGTDAVCAPRTFAETA